MSMRGIPAIHSSAPSMPRQASQQHVDALVGAHQAEAQHDGHARRRRGRPGARRLRRQVREDAVGDHVHALGVDAELLDQPRAAVLGVHDDRVEALVQAPLRGALTGPRLARQDVVGGEHERPAGPPPGQQRRRRAAGPSATGSGRRRPRARRGGSAACPGTCSASFATPRATRRVREPRRAR